MVNNKVLGSQHFAILLFNCIYYIIGLGWGEDLMYLVTWIQWLSLCLAWNRLIDELWYDLTVQFNFVYGIIGVGGGRGEDLMYWVI